MMNRNEEPAQINLEKYLRKSQKNELDGKYVGVSKDDCVLISTRLLPEVYDSLKGFCKAERIYQTAVLNAALISYMEKKKRETGIDYAAIADVKANVRPTLKEIQEAMPESEQE